MSNYGSVTSPELAGFITEIIDEVECRTSFTEPALHAYQPEANAELQIKGLVRFPENAAEGLAERAAMARRYASAITLYDALMSSEQDNDGTVMAYARQNAKNFDKSKMYFSRFEAESTDNDVVVEMMTFVAAAGKVTGKLVDITIADDELNRVLTLHRTVRPDDEILLTAAFEAEDPIHPSLQAVVEYFSEDTKQAEAVAFALELLYDRMLADPAGFVTVPPSLTSLMAGPHKQAIEEFIMVQVKRAQEYAHLQDLEAYDANFKMPSMTQLVDFQSAIRTIDAA